MESSVESTDESGEESETDEPLNDENDNPDVTFIPITSTLVADDNVTEFYNLPKHERCSSHSLNLVATTDANKVSDRSFKALFRSAESKLQQLWNKQQRSSQASDFIQEKLKGLFLVLNATRWNSFYYAMARVNGYLRKNPTGMREVFENFTIPYLRVAEEEIIGEYVKILYPVTRALDILQADKKVSAGFLLPTIVSLRNQLSKIERDPNLKHSKALITAIQEGITARFGHLFDETSWKLAAISHPRFKLSWIPEENREKEEQLFRDQVKEERTRMGMSQQVPPSFLFTNQCPRIFN